MFIGEIVELGWLLYFVIETISEIDYGGKGRGGSH